MRTPLPGKAASPHPPHREVFILRLWRGDSESEAAWQGEVQHVESGQRFALQNLSELVQALQKQLSKPPAPRHRLR